MMAKEKPPITVVGDVGGRIAIIVVRLQALRHMHIDIHTCTAHETQMRTTETEKLLLRGSFLTNIATNI